VEVGEAVAAIEEDSFWDCLLHIGSEQGVEAEFVNLPQKAHGERDQERPEAQIEVAVAELVVTHRGIKKGVSQEADPNARKEMHDIIPGTEVVIAVKRLPAGNSHQSEDLDEKIDGRGQMDFQDFLAKIRQERQNHPADGGEHDEQRGRRSRLVGVFDCPVDKTRTINEQQDEGLNPGDSNFLCRFLHAFILGQNALLYSRLIVEMAFREKVESCQNEISANNGIMETKDIIAGNIAGLRKKKGLTQAELASQLGFTDKAVSKWERGLSLPDAPTLQELALLFGVDINYLFVEHAYDPLDAESEKKLHRKTVMIKLIYIGSLFLVFTILISILLSAIADIYDETAKIRAYLFILPGLAFLALVVNIAFGHNGRMNLILSSVLTWALADALYYFLGHRLVLIFAIAALVQTAIVLFPKLSSPKDKKKK
jgi:transcriptional regulator with XRE-family HTH domain